MNKTLFVACVEYNTLDVDDEMNDIYNTETSNPFQRKGNAINWLNKQHSEIDRTGCKEVHSNDKYCVFELVFNGTEYEVGNCVLNMYEPQFNEEYVIPAVYKSVVAKMNKIQFPNV